MGRDLPVPVGDERRQPDTSTAPLQRSVGEEGGGELGGHQGAPVTLEGFPDVGRHVAEGGEGSPDGGRESSCRTSSEPHRGSSVRGVGMAVRSHLLLLPPLGPSVLKPNLEKNKI